MVVKISGKNIMIDDEDMPIFNAYKWHIDKKDGYARHTIHDGNKVYAILLHRVIMGCNRGDGKIVDHISCDKNDCRKSNLRICDKTGNARNVTKRNNNKSGFKGVSWSKAANKWVAQIGINGTRKHIGVFRCAKKAHLAYIEASKELHGQYGRAL